MNAPVSPLSTTATGCVQGWHAALALGFEPDGQSTRTVLANRKRIGPLAVQRPFYPEGGACHVYVLHPPGGVVGGDRLDIAIDVASDASALITAPGATKFYRSTGAIASLDVRLAVRGSLEWLPHENIFFREARVSQKTVVDLAPGARFIGWESHCLGRPAAGEVFDRGSARIATDILRGGTPLQSDRLGINPGSGHNTAASLRGWPIVATLYATPVDPDHARSLQASFHRSTSEGAIGLTLIEKLLIARYLGPSTAAARRQLVALWEVLRPAVMGRKAILPRIWAT